ncbi:MAG: hypothetical protein HY245_13890 [Rhizobiales bacterium]|nr:hypothetical protein [Hyphomicrobiales bacterium]MBI3674483.1 hypothetical protein [Hyphomicrobiales bacterium]
MLKSFAIPALVLAFLASGYAKAPTGGGHLGHRQVVEFGKGDLQVPSNS